MFDFLLQRFRKKQPDSASFAEEKKSARQAAVNDARQMAIQQAEQLPEDENEAVTFLLQSAFADARFIAAQKIHSEEALARIKIAMRNTDRRVIRLMQSRLDTLSQHEKQQSRILACIDSARRLKNEAHLLPNQVAELDRQWDDVKKAGIDNILFVQQYEKIREAIGIRLTDQIALQRQVIDRLAALKCLEEEEAALTPSEREMRLAMQLASSETWAQSREWVALPRHLVSDFEEMARRLKDNTQQHTQMHEALAIRAKTLDEWESADVSSLKPDDLRDKWRSLPAVNDAKRMSGMQARLDTLMSRIGSDDRPEQQESGQKQSSEKVGSLFAYSLSLMKKAIEEGAIREATKQSERMTHLDFSVFEPDAEQRALLAELRAELKKLAGWARWGGQTSRDALIRIVQALPGQNYPLGDLAAAVVDAREKWKALNASSGMASKSQWQLFDAACNRAYEPVLEYARSQVVAREQNMQKARSLIGNVQETLPRLNLPSGEEDKNDAVDWRSLVEYQRQMQRAWQQIGPITRKEKKRLDAEFEQIMRPLNTLLKEEAKVEIERRRKLIEEVGKLDPQDRKSSRIARQLQEKWQERTRVFPLDNREDQKLWQQFRGASEAIFAHRSRLNEEAEKEWLHNFHEKEKICEKLEAERTETVEKILQVLKDADAKWRAAGPVSRDHENAIQNRYDNAVGILLSQIQAIRDQEKRGQVEAFIEKLSVCQRLENVIPDQPALAKGLKALWDMQSSDEWKKQLNPRFDAALKALAGKDAVYAEELKSRQPQLYEQLLRLEIAASIDSPPEFAAKRLQIQMEILKDSLSGNRDILQHDQLDALCTLPVLTDTASAERIVRLIRKINGLPA